MNKSNTPPTPSQIYEDGFQRGKEYGFIEGVKYAQQQQLEQQRLQEQQRLSALQQNQADQEFIQRMQQTESFYTKYFI